MDQCYSRDSIVNAAFKEVAKKRGPSQAILISPLSSFRCSKCDRTWPSARVTVLFHYRLRASRGTVLMRPFGQACRSCKNDFTLPGFSEAVVRETLLRLLHRVRKNCYGEVEDDDDDRDSQRSTRHTKPHEANLCEACSQGICTLKEEDD